MRHWPGGLRSYFVALRASAALGRALRQQRLGKRREALSTARGALDLLRRPFVFRQHPAEGSSLATLTVLVEQLAVELKEQGACRQDLTDALSFLGTPPNDPPALNTWVPYLEARLAASPETPSA